MSTPTVSDNCTAALVARFLKARGVDRVFGLCGGHIMPIWMRLHAEGIRIIDVRDERAAVYMAHAHAELTGGLGVAIVTAGPGVTNAMTGIANAHVAKASVLVLSGTPPRAQENRGALQDMAHTDFVRPLTRYARTVREPDLALQELDEAVSRALGHAGEPGPVYLDFPIDTLRSEVSRAVQLPEFFIPKPRRQMLPDPAVIDEAVELLWSARRPLFISGRGARAAGAPLQRLLERLNALYLDTGESRGLVPEEHPSVVAAMRGSVMSEADVVVTVGRRLISNSPTVRLRCSAPLNSCVLQTAPPSCATTGAVPRRSTPARQPRSKPFWRALATALQPPTSNGRAAPAPSTNHALTNWPPRWRSPQPAVMA